VEAETREQRQLRLIRELVELLAAESIPVWLRGGWAIDFLLGEITRPHEDIDLFAWVSRGDDLAACLVRAEFQETHGPPPNTQRNFRKDGETFHIVLLGRTSEGKLVTPGGRWAPANSQEEWPDDMLDAAPGRLGDLAVPTISAAALLYEKERAALIPGHPLTPKHSDDIVRLRTALSKR
jgi:hypothetical protein